MSHFHQLHVCFPFLCLNIYSPCSADFQREEKNNNNIWTLIKTQTTLKHQQWRSEATESTRESWLHIPAPRGAKSAAADDDEEEEEEDGGESDVQSHARQLFYKQKGGKVCLLMIRFISS